MNQLEALTTLVDAARQMPESRLLLRALKVADKMIERRRAKRERAAGSLKSEPCGTFLTGEKVSFGNDVGTVIEQSSKWCYKVDFGNGVIADVPGVTLQAVVPCFDESLAIARRTTDMRAKPKRRKKKVKYGNPCRECRGEFGHHGWWCSKYP